MAEALAITREADCAQLNGEYLQRCAHDPDFGDMTYDAAEAYWAHAVARLREAA